MKEFLLFSHLKDEEIEFERDQRSYLRSVQFSLVTQSCPTLCDLMNRSTPGLPVHHQLPGFTQTHVHPLSRWYHPAISSSVVPFSCPQSLPVSESFPMSHCFAWSGQSTGVSALASFLTKKWKSDLLQNGLVGSPCSPRDSQESSPTAQCKKHKFFSAPLFSQSNSHIHTWLLEKP